MEESLFGELVAAFEEAIEHENGNIQLNSNTVTIPDEEIEMHQLLFRSFYKMSKPEQQRLVQYADELLQAAN